MGGSMYAPRYRMQRAPETHLTVQPATLDFALYLIMIERLNLN